MVPQCQTLFSVCLFCALSALLLWTARRERNAERRRAARARMLCRDESGRVVPLSAAVFSGD
jgi:hypothetical protein